MTGILLDNDVSCRQELERVANGIATLTVDHTRVLTELGDLEEMWEMVEAGVYNAIEPEKGATAAQVKALALQAIGKNEKTAELRKQVKAARVELTSLERRIRSLEKRMGAAQSALKSHESESRSAGFAGKANL